MKKLTLILIIFGYVYSADIPLQKITLVEKSTSIDLYSPFHLVYKQKFYYGDSHIEERLGFMGKSIGKYTRQVPESYSYIKRYKGLKLSALGMLLTGIGLTSLGIYQVTQRDEPGNAPPSFVVGLVLSTSSIIPNHISKFMIEPAVEKYNRKIQTSRRY